MRAYLFLSRLHSFHRPSALHAGYRYDENYILLGTDMTIDVIGAQETDDRRAAGI